MGLVRRVGLLIAASACVSVVAPTAAQATIVGLSGSTDAPSACYAPQQSITASTSCQLFAGAQLRVVGLARRDDGGVRFVPQPMTLFTVQRGRAPVPILRWVYHDDNEADDNPVVVPARSTDYQLRFEGNEDMGPAVSSTMVVDVGVRITIPTVARRGSGGTRVRVPVIVALGSRAQRGRLELRRCKRPKLYSARSCAARGTYDVVARRMVDRSGLRTFTIRMPARTQRSYEVAFRPAAARSYAVTRQAFRVVRGYDNRTSYRYVVRRDAFGTR